MVIIVFTIRDPIWSCSMRLINTQFVKTHFSITITHTTLLIPPALSFQLHCTQHKTTTYGTVSMFVLNWDVTNIGILFQGKTRIWLQERNDTPVVKTYNNNKRRTNVSLVPMTRRPNTRCKLPCVQFRKVP
jgi:hypothetical protein